MGGNSLLLVVPAHDENDVRENGVVKKEGQSVLNGHLGRLPIVEAQVAVLKQKKLCCVTKKFDCLACGYSVHYFYVWPSNIAVNLRSDVHSWPL